MLRDNCEVTDDISPPLTVHSDLHKLNSELHNQINSIHIVNIDNKKYQQEMLDKMKA